MNAVKFSFYLLALLSISLFSCDKEEVTPPQAEPNNSSAKEISQTQNAFDDVYSVTESALDETEINKTSSLCATITLDTTAKTLLVDFGAGCTGPDGRFRTGAIQINYIGKYRAPSSTFSISLIGYSVDGIQLQGTLVINSFDRNSDGNLFFNISVAKGKATFSDGSTVTYSTERTYTWTKGEGSGTLSDNVYEVTGNSLGQNSDGEGYIADITEPLVYKLECAKTKIFYPAAGKLSLQFNNAAFPLIIQFGSGTCDKDVVFMWINNSYPIVLP